VVESIRRRNRRRQMVPLADRLEQAARAAREAAKAAKSEAERDALLKAAQRYQTAAHLDEWLKSPGVQPPA